MNDLSNGLRESHHLEQRPFKNIIQKTNSSSNVLPSELRQTRFGFRYVRCLPDIPRTLSEHDQRSDRAENHIKSSDWTYGFDSKAALTINLPIGHAVFHSECYCASSDVSDGCNNAHHDRHSTKQAHYVLSQTGRLPPQGGLQLLISNIARIGRMRFFGSERYFVMKLRRN
jgi:hypothetical protein